MILGSTQDDKELYLMKLDLIKVRPGPLVRWDLATKQETSLSSPSDVDRFSALSPSMDDHWLISTSLEGLFVRPLSGGDWKPLAAGDCCPYATTADGGLVVSMASGSNNRDTAE